ncbi:DUF1904 family protein [Brevibacillus sp. SYSU BS000544]|uniref:DUF1904 family protein n=1 Tax=Brevibacillus sp. SYSU BS000544 TaxID=3416443 RepID=UPI003CE52237
MPHLLIRGIKPEQLCEISKPMVEELALVCECGTDNFTLEVLSTTGVFDGKVVPSFPFIEVAWFERGPEVRNRFAEAVTKHVLSLGLPEVEIAFVAYREDSYYINGKSCQNLASAPDNR